MSNTLEMITQQAAGWMARRDRGLSRSEATAFEAWIAADGRHQIELNRIESSWNEFNAINLSPELGAELSRLDEEVAQRAYKRKVIAYFSGAFAAAACVAVVYLGSRPASAPSLQPATVVTTAAADSYHTVASTARRQVLPDGSVVELNGDSQIDVDFSPSVRAVHLRNGEAHFTVAKNPDRPFIVVTGAAVSLRAVGTAFNVRLAPDAVDVIVTEGIVAIQPAATEPASAVTGTDDFGRLTAGERALLALKGTQVETPVISRLAASEMDQALAWRSTWLVFDRTRLDEVVSAFNRHNQHQLELGDPSLGARTLSGSFRADNLAGFIRMVRPIVDVTPETRSETITVLQPAR